MLNGTPDPTNERSENSPDMSFRESRLQPVDACRGCRILNGTPDPTNERSENSPDM
jgi:hypothetical protein